MVPNVTAKGRSFNGAFAYYMHDKRQEGEARRDTAERVAWTETRNLATDDPDTARRVMIATARQADALKKAAGVKAAGRKSTQHVYAYSLSWSTAEAGQIDRAEMVRAVDASLKALGAEHLQAVVIAHQDTKHPHVHVVLNRVDPATGKMHGFSNDHRQLDAWALAYREARGEHLKYTPARAEKRAARAQGREVAPTFTRAATPPPVKPAGPDFERVAVKPTEARALQERAAELAKRSAAMRERHGQEWTDLSASLQTTKGAAADMAAAEIDAARASIKEEYRPFWRDLFKQQAAERREQRRLGLFALAWTAWTATREERGGGKIDRAFLSSVVQFIASKDRREAHLEKRHEQQRRKLGAIVRRATDHAARLANAKCRQTVQLERAAFARRRLELIDRQAREKEQNRQDWRDLTAAKAALQNLRPPVPSGRHFQTAGEIRAAAGVDRTNRPRPPRSASRSRTRTRGDDPPKPRQP